MELRHLRYFLCVAEEMHFGRAALRLGISQPPLSQQIRALEEELGVRLFERTSRRVRLTEAGHLFEPEARATLTQAERAIEIARRAERGELGKLALGFTVSGPFAAPVAGALYQFRQQHPQVDLSLHEMGRDAQIEAVRSGQIDMGIVRDFLPPPLPAGMVAHCLVTEDMVLALREDHPLALRPEPPRIADLAEEPMIFYAPANGVGFTDHFLTLCEAAGFAPRVAHEADSLAALLGLVAAGFGGTVLARSLARLQVDRVVHRPFDVPIVSSLWLIHPERLSPTGRAFRALIDGSEGQPVSRRTA